MILLSFCLENITEYYSFDAWSLQRILIKHIFEKWHELLTNEIRVLSYLLMEYFLLQLLHLSSWKRIAQAA